MVAGLAVDTAGLTPGGGGVAVVRSGGFVQVIHDGQVGGRGVGGGTLQQDDSVKPRTTGELLQLLDDHSIGFFRNRDIQPDDCRRT